MPNLDLEPGSSTTRTPLPKTRATGSGEAKAIAAIKLIVQRRRLEQGIRPDGTIPGPPPVGNKLRARLDAMPVLTAEQIAARDKRAAERDAIHRDDERKQKWLALCALRGARYASCRLSNYEATTDKQRAVLGQMTAYRDNLRDNVEAGRGIVLFGPSGTGKDHLLMSLAGAAIVREDFSVGWQNVMDWFGSVRDSFDDDRNEAQLIAELSRPDVLMLSDPLPPFGKLTDFQANMLFRVVDKRYSMRKPTWVSVNCKNRVEAIDRMGMQIVDRLRHDTVAAFCDWESYRTPA